MFSCCIIGGSSLALKCALQMQRHSVEIKAIYSKFDHLKKFAIANNILLFTDIEKFYSYLITESYDYLFSIINPLKQDLNIIKSARIAAINYHDSLLPVYAGCNATSWAILNNESRHGITWHIMNELIDNGPILLQGEFSVNPTDTALQLNLKCYQMAIKVFDDLLLKLSQFDTIAKLVYEIPNKFSKQHYHRKNELPDHKCCINWDWSSDNIYRVFRACYYGNYENPFSFLFIVIENKSYKVTRMCILDKKSILNPGTIIYTSETGTRRISTIDYDIEIETSED